MSYSEWRESEIAFLERIANRKDAEGDKVSAILFRNEAEKLREEMKRDVQSGSVTPLPKKGDA